MWTGDVGLKTKTRKIRFRIRFRIWTLLCIAVLICIRDEELMLRLSLSPPHFLNITVVEMAHFNSSNVIINGGTFISSQGSLNIINKDPEIGMLVFMSVLKKILIDE